MKLGNKGLLDLILMITLALIIAAVLAYTLGFWHIDLFDQNKSQKVSNNNHPPAVLANYEAVVEIRKYGFFPQTIKIKKGEQVKWVNKDPSGKHIVASDPFPTDSDIPELVSVDGLALDESYSFIFETSGKYTYHDELNPFTFKGTVIVE